MLNDPVFTIHSMPFDENYKPSQTTRMTTNFANLARGESRQQNLRNALQMMATRCNQLAHWDNPTADRYSIGLDIISVDMCLGGADQFRSIIEMLRTTLVDHKTGEHIDGIFGNNFSSYVRDFDFSIRLPQHNSQESGLSVPEDFGDVHGDIFQSFIQSATYKAHFSKPPVICLSVSHNKIYHQTPNRHPILGLEYLANESSLTEQYFEKMGLKARYFMPANSMAPLAFYFTGDLLTDYTNLELISTIATMESFQKIYRPEIYNANSAAGQCFKPSLSCADYSLTHVVYDRQERSELAISQGKFAEEHFIKPYQKYAQCAAT